MNTLSNTTYGQRAANVYDELMKDILQKINDSKPEDLDPLLGDLEIVVGRKKEAVQLAKEERIER